MILLSLNHLRNSANSSAVLCPNGIPLGREKQGMILNILYNSTLNPNNPEHPNFTVNVDRFCFSPGFYE